MATPEIKTQHPIVGDDSGNLEKNVKDNRFATLDDNYEGKPTEEELKTLRRVPGNVPWIAYLICFVEFCERGSYYGVQPTINNFVNRPFPIGGNGAGAPPDDPNNQQTAGALGLGTQTASAVSSSFSFLAYALPMVFGWLSDTKTGRFKMICYGVGVFGLGHILLVVAGAPSLLQNGGSKAPYFLGLYILSVGAAMFKPNVSPLLLDQMPHSVPIVEETKKGERVIIDTEATTERVMLWFYLLINIGGFMSLPTSYCEKRVGWWLTFLVPLINYIPLPFLLWWIKPKLILHPPGGSDLGNVFRVLGICFKRGGVKLIGRHGFFDLAKPSHIAAAGLDIPTRWNDQFVEDVRRTFQASGMFLFFFPIQNINDNGLGSAQSAQSTMLRTDGLPNDLLASFNSLSIIVFIPILNYGLYPFLAARRIKYGPVARMTTGFLLASIGGVAYTVLQYYAYQESPCGYYGSSADECVDNGLVADISLWFSAIPIMIGGVSELFCNVPAYGISYSRAPKNMRGLLSAINLFNSALAYAINLAFAGLVVDPYLIWDFAGPAIWGFVSAIVFYVLFRHIDKEEYTISQNGDYDITHIDDRSGSSVVGTSVNEKEHEAVPAPAAITENEAYGISPKQ